MTYSSNSKLKLMNNECVEYSMTHARKSRLSSCTVFSYCTYYIKVKVMYLHA